MASYLIGFHLAPDADRHGRRASLIAQVRARPTTACWDEMDALLLVETDETLDVLFERIYLGSALSAARDMLLVVDHHAGEARAVGPIRDRDRLKAQFRTCTLAGEG